LTYRDTLADAVTTDVRRGSAVAQRRLFVTYVEHMLAHRGGSRQRGYHNREQTLRWLSWLATAMIGQSQTVFRVEHLQHQWLPTHAMGWLYALTDRLGGGLACGVVTGLLFGVGLKIAVPRSPDSVLYALLAGLVVVLTAGLMGGRSGGRYANWMALWVTLRDAALGWVVVACGVGFTTGLLFMSTEPHAWYAQLNPFLIVMNFAFGLLTYGLFAGLMGGLVGGLAGGPGVRPRRIAVVESFGWSPGKAVSGAAAGLAVGAACMISLMGLFSLIFGEMFGPSRPWTEDLRDGAIFALASGVIGGLIGGLIGSTAKVAVNAEPNQGIHTSVRVGVMFAVGAVLLGGVVGGLASGTRIGLQWGLACGLAGGVALGLSYGGYACLSHFALRLVLWRSGIAPLNYVRFLDYCVERIFLRRVGGGYIIVHRLLMEYFASLYEERPRKQRPRSTDHDTLVGRKNAGRDQATRS
jgi:eukaryotic-like serine/threonine-protein kinase